MFLYNLNTTRDDDPRTVFEFDGIEQVRRYAARVSTYLAHEQVDEATYFTSDDPAALREQAEANQRASREALEIDAEEGLLTHPTSEYSVVIEWREWNEAAGEYHAIPALP